MQRELGAYLYRSWSVVLVYTSAWGSYPHVLVTLIMENVLLKVEHVSMALTAGAAWAINCKAKPVGT